ncbi:MAG: hypothetical protein MZV70_16975 [Desulfobacterales bacterium]|nr:hypothetical protein [Desulfobacterales bacterium]
MQRWNRELLKVLAILIVMLGVLYAVLKIVKRRMTPSDGIIEMLHYQPLGEQGYCDREDRGERLSRCRCLR